MNLRFLSYHIDDGIAEIIMNHPPVNAMSVPLLDEIIACFERAAADDAVHAIILGSAVPGRFCAGLDLNAFSEGDSENVRALLERLYTGFTNLQFRLGKPSIAAVNGTARGGGMTLAISCDMIVAERSADLGYPEIDVGVIPAIHFTHLPRIIGKHRAFDLLFTGRAFDAQEAHTLGLVSRGGRRWTGHAGGPGVGTRADRQASPGAENGTRNVHARDRLRLPQGRGGRRRKFLQCGCHG